MHANCFGNQGRGGRPWGSWYSSKSSQLVVFNSISYITFLLSFHIHLSRLFMKLFYPWFQIIQIDEPALREGLPLRKTEHAHYLDWAVHAFRITNFGGIIQHVGILHMGLWWFTFHIMRACGILNPSTRITTLYLMNRPSYRPNFGCIHGNGMVFYWGCSSL